ncbi:hypothetical protein [Cognatilysobacter lacus]|uniref:Uncharacterized protein n=1 Tax=Cognatilysobacter lacus TaxID=1643323 RepID=A0A5D8Z8H3_9GAMM|nr:hypothetical protein [Lysobacter lacus]TZF90422.1 hypothetical protein FW784_05315 [Lysobacter lacus]
MARTNIWIPMLALVAATAYLQPAAAAPAARQRPAIERRGQDLLPSAQALRLSRAHKSAPAPGTTAAAVTVDDVGDVDSFDRNLKWLGVTNAFVTLDSACDPATTEHCQVIGPGQTNFNFADVAHITLPGKSAKSLMCYWFSPVINVTYSNPGPTPAVSLLRYNPTLTVDNPMLSDPALIDPNTGLPFGGHLTTSMTSSEFFQVPLPPATTISERTRDSAVCIAGFLNRRMMIDTYGFSEAQADEFFKKPMTIHLNVSGAVRGVALANFVFGLRIIGD